MWAPELSSCESPAREQEQDPRVATSSVFTANVYGASHNTRPSAQYSKTKTQAPSSVERVDIKTGRESLFPSCVL